MSMLNRISRRLGFEQSVPVAVIESWAIPTIDKPLIELAPRDGAAACLVDQFGRVQPKGASWSLELSVVAGARWVPFSQSDRVRQKMVAPGVAETEVKTPAGPVTQRVAAGIVDGQPVAVIEIENTGGVAIAVGAVARPLRLDGRGYIASAQADLSGIAIDGSRAVRFDAAPASVAASDSAGGDLLNALPGPTSGVEVASATCKSGGAQAAAVWPLAHTATLQIVIELAAPTRAAAAVPTTADINRGWQSHLSTGLRVDVDDLEIGEQASLAARSLLTMWPERPSVPTAVSAMAELGFGRDAGRLFDELDRVEDDDAVLRSLARWAQLGEQTHQLEDLERVLGRVARAAHVVAGRSNQGGQIAGQPWLKSALVTLGGRLHQIDQPDVGDRVQGLGVAEKSTSGAADRVAQLAAQRDKRGVWPQNQAATAAEYVRALRAIVIEDAGDELRVLPEVPMLWRGRPLDVFGVPVANGTISFGLRWHGARPALLWEATLAPEAPFRITAPAIDPEFSSTDREGEALLADPGWTT